MDKNERFHEFIKKLEETEPVDSGKEAFEMLANTLNCQLLPAFFDLTY